VLASGSPRRRHLLGEAGLRFRVAPADVDERFEPGETPERHAARLAREKACVVARRTEVSAGDVVLGADTIVVIDGVVLGKPADPDEAMSHLSRLAGRTHRVLTAVALARAGGRLAGERLVESAVTLRALAADEIRAYVATGEPLDKAGAYAVQGEGRRFITRIEGSETNVIGLPMDETLALLRAAGLAR
jgi:septum formation protein